MHQLPAANPFKMLPTQLHHELPASQVEANPGLDQVTQSAMRKHRNKNFEEPQHKLNLMVVGKSGLGKTTFLNTLFSTDLFELGQDAFRHYHAKKDANQTTRIEQHVFDLEEDGVSLRLTVLDTPGFGDQLNREDGLKPILTYLDGQYDY